MRLKQTIQISVLLAAFAIASSPILAQSNRAMTFDDVMGLRGDPIDQFINDYPAVDHRK